MLNSMKRTSIELVLLKVHIIIWDMLQLFFFNYSFEYMRIITHNKYKIMLNVQLCITIAFEFC